MFRSTTISRELVLNLAKVIFMLKHSVKLRRYILCGDVAVCLGTACVLCDNTHTHTHTHTPFHIIYSDVILMSVLT